MKRSEGEGDREGVGGRGSGYKSEEAARWKERREESRSMSW